MEVTGAVMEKLKKKSVF